VHCSSLYSDAACESTNVRSYAVLWQARLVVHDVQSSDADRDDFLFCTAVLETGKPPVVLRVLKSAAAALFDVEGVVGTELAVDGDGDGDSDSEMDTATGTSDAAACTPDACTAVADAAAGRVRALLTVFDDTTTSPTCRASCPRIAVTYEAAGAAVIDHPGCGCDDTGVSNIVEVPGAPVAGTSTGAAAVQARAAGATAGGQQRRSVKAAAPSTRRFASTMVPATSGALKDELADLAPTLFAWLRGARESVLSVAIAAMELLRLWCRLLAVDDTALEQVAAALTTGDTQCPYSDVMAALKTAEVESVRRILAGDALSTTRTGSCSQFPAASRCLSPTTIHLHASLDSVAAVFVDALIAGWFVARRDGQPAVDIARPGGATAPSAAPVATTGRGTRAAAAVANAKLRGLKRSRGAADDSGDSGDDDSDDSEGYVATASDDSSDGDDGGTVNVPPATAPVDSLPSTPPPWSPVPIAPWWHVMGKPGQYVGASDHGRLNVVDMMQACMRVFDKSHRGTEDFDTAKGAVRCVRFELAVRLLMRAKFVQSREQLR
jgi:hypothetical protein